ncbi:MAG TPA: DUF2336 domain-containing protein [Verrucomicrobiae bacterium]|nr:DUF2336 domain-containing protein [Verrucomicrobiae bacterium]
MSTNEDIRFLVGLARDKSVEGRKRLVAVVNDIFFSDHSTLTDYERALITDILHRLIGDLIEPVRQALAERLRKDGNGSQSLIDALLQDDIEMAAPVLRTNEPWLDVELVEVIRHRALEHQLMQSMRRTKGDAASDWGVAAGDSDFIKGLLDGNDDPVTEAAMAYLVEQANTVDGFQEPILRRSDLSDRLVKRILLWILAALRQHLLERFDCDMTRLDDAVEAAAAELIARIADERDSAAESATTKLAKILRDANLLPLPSLVQLLRQGEVGLFVAALSEMTGLRLTLIRRLLFESGGEGLMTACRAIGLDKPNAAAIFLLTRRARPGDWAVDPRELARAMSIFDRVEPAAAQGVVARWRRDPDFLCAIRTVEEARADAAAV